nr:hypothetical protein [Tanacetum cinerariifolium]
MTNQTIPNDVGLNAPLIIVTLPNIIKLTFTNFLSCKLQIEATLVGYGSHLSPPPTITQNQTTTAYVAWHRQDRLLYGTLVEPTIVHLVSLTTSSKALWDTLSPPKSPPQSPTRSVIEVGLFAREWRLRRLRPPQQEDEDEDQGHH